MAPCGQPGEKHCEVGGLLAGNDEEVQVEQGVKYIQTHVEPEAVMPIRSRATPLGGQKSGSPPVLYGEPLSAPGYGRTRAACTGVEGALAWGIHRSGLWVVKGPSLIRPGCLWFCLTVNGQT